MVIDEDTAGCFDRYAIKLAMMGDAEAAYGLGYNLLTKNDTPDNKRRKYFYHDDYDALYWFSYIAEKQEMHQRQVKQSDFLQTQRVRRLTIICKKSLLFCVKQL